MLGALDAHGLGFTAVAHLDGQPEGALIPVQDGHRVRRGEQ